MTSSEIMVLAWPLIGVVSVGLFGWWMLGWIDRKHPKKAAAQVGPRPEPLFSETALAELLSVPSSRAEKMSEPVPASNAEVIQKLETILVSLKIEGDRHNEALADALKATRQMVGQEASESHGDNSNASDK